MLFILDLKIFLYTSYKILNRSTQKKTITIEKMKYSIIILFCLRYMLIFQYPPLQVGAYKICMFNLNYNSSNLNQSTVLSSISSVCWIASFVSSCSKFHQFEVIVITGRFTILVDQRKIAGREFVGREFTRLQVRRSSVRGGRS